MRQALDASESLGRLSFYLGTNSCPTTYELCSLVPAADAASKALLLRVETRLVSISPSMVASGDALRTVSREAAKTLQCLVETFVTASSLDSAYATAALRAALAQAASSLVLLSATTPVSP